MKKLILLAMVIGLFANGCATTPITWVKDGSTEEQFKRDNYQCVQESRTQWGGSGLMLIGSQLSAQRQANKLYLMCMESKGYHVMDKSKQVNEGKLDGKLREKLWIEFLEERKLNPDALLTWHDFLKNKGIK